jgi:mono/diheme cytochrome c family protein
VQEHLFKVIQGLFILVLPVTAITWAKSKTQLSPVAKAGQKVFQQNCAMCHYANQAKKKIGPGMKGILKNKELPYSHKPATVANVRAQIEKGNPQGKPMPMPPFGSKLSKPDMSDLVAYLKTL